MDQVLCEAKFKTNRIAKIILAIAGALVLLSVIITASSFHDGSTYRILLVFAHFLFDLALVSLYDNPVSFFCFWIGIALLLYALLITFMMNRCALAIYDSRVSGKASFGRQVNLPLNQISATGLGYFDSIAIATSAGKISFWLIENRDEVCDVLNKLLANAQKEAPSKAEATTANTDQIVKYKDLLDKGIITQEEFDAKKKQLLDL